MEDFKDLTNACYSLYLVGQQLVLNTALGDGATAAARAKPFDAGVGLIVLGLGFADSDDGASTTSGWIKIVIGVVFLALGVESLIAVIFLIIAHYMTLGRAAQYAAEKKAKAE